ncbi:MAG TPA: hypothetical protein VEV43_05160 [Actinomycetota bacterium]|nr:hypothetical protein [Actinomycetota bacterium]
MARRYRFRYYPGVRDALSTAPPEARHAFGETNLLLFQVMADYPLIRLIDVIIA